MNQRPRLLLVVLFCGTCATVVAQPPIPPSDAILSTLRAGHPRLMSTAGDFETLRMLCAGDGPARAWFVSLKRQADDLLSEPPVEYVIPDGKRLLAVSRAAKERVFLLSLMYQMTGNDHYAERLWKELNQVTQFRDWNPSHFLDTAEMTLAVSIGYDWLYEKWTPGQRQQLRESIVAMGLNPGLSVYRKRSGWSKSRHNWNQVCNGGMTVGALAISDAEPDVAAEVLHSALTSLPLAMQEFRPDGGWGEGPGYWRYATEYNVYLLAALRTALGTDFGFGDMSGFAVTGDFPIHFCGPTGLTFNYADARDHWSGAPQLFWLATAFDQPAYARAQLPYAGDAPDPLDLLWGAAWLKSAEAPHEQPLDRLFTGVQVVTMRTAWNDPSATFVAVKGGDNRVNHGHLDLGTFVLDADGVRWAVDLGPDDYNIPGYFGAQRWSYYRNMTEGHNTLLIGGANQSPAATAEVIRFSSTRDSVNAVIDLSRAWPDAQRVWRGVALQDRRDIVVRDEVQSEHPVDAVWHMHTGASVQIDGQHAVLTEHGKTMFARIVQPSDAVFTVAPATTTPPQRPLNGINRLGITVPDPVRQFELIVLLSTDPDATADDQWRRPLREWPDDAAARQSAAP